MTKIDLEETTDIVRRLLKQQAELALASWSSVGALRHKNRRDFATEVDLQIERNIKDQLRRRFPDHGFRGEETAAENPESENQWLIDPIDGTKWYAAGSSHFSISVALLHRDEPVLGVVHVPASGQCFSGFRGGGAVLDGRLLRGPRVDRLSDAIASVDTPGSSDLSPEERGWFERKLVQLTRRVYRVRALGVSSLAACWLASGALDAHVDLTGHNEPQDIAAGRIIMKECGMRVAYLEAPAGPPRIVAAPPAIWDDLWGLLTE